MKSLSRGALTLLVATASVCSAQSYTWKNVQIIAGGFVSGLLFHPSQKDLAYARTDIGGAYRWDAGSKRWIPITDWISFDDWNLLGIESFAVDPADPQRLYMACGTYSASWGGYASILRSNDQGRTFERASLNIKMGGNEDGRFHGERLAVDPNSGNILYFGSRRNGLWKSTDRGANWSQVASFPIQGDTNGQGVTFVRFLASSGTTGNATPVIYAGVAPNRALYRSTDAGATWNVVDGGPSMIPFHGALASDGWMYLTYGDNPGPNGITTGQVWKLQTKTGEWKDITPPKGQGGFGGISVDAQRPGVVMVGTIDRWWPGDEMYRTLDGGATWTALGAKAVRDVSASPYVTFNGTKAGWGNWMGSVEIDPFDSNHVIYGTGQTIWGTHDATEADAANATHWAVEAAGVEETAILALASPPAGAHLLSAMGDIGGFRHDDFTVSPRGGMMKNPVFSTTGSIAFAGQKPSVVVRTGYTGDGNAKSHGAISQDGGTTWQPFPTEPAGADGAGQAVVGADGTVILWSLQAKGVYRSADAGATWTAVESLPPNGSSNYTALLADSVNPKKFYAVSATTQALFASTDGGATFRNTGNAFSLKDKPRATPGVEGDFWLASGGGNSSNVYHTTDSGENFQSLTGLREAYSIGLGAPAKAGGYAALYLAGRMTWQGADTKGFFRSDDKGQTWVRINDAQHQTNGFVHGDPRIYGRVYIGTGGRGIVYGDLAAKLEAAAAAPAECNPCELGVKVLDSNGAAVPNVTVEWSSDNGTFSAAAVPTDSQGVAKSTLTPAHSGAMHVTARVEGLGVVLFTTAHAAAAPVMPRPSPREPGRGR